ncbi:MAG: hypothetical protein Q9168_005503 [Polycauliona sp. 1 TL-2023]
MGKVDGDEIVEEEREEEQKKNRMWSEDDRGEINMEGLSALPAPESEGGAWEDARWLMKIAANIYLNPCFPDHASMIDSSPRNPTPSPQK